MEEMNTELRNFIITFCKKHKITQIDLDNLNIDSSIDLDLDIFDIDIDLFVTDFVTRFNIDYSGFSWENYGYPIGSSSAGIIRCLFGYKRKWVKQVCHYLYTPRIKVGVFQRAIETGILI